MEIEEEISEIEENEEIEHNIEIQMKKEVEDKIIWLTNNYPEEISAFLTGEIKDGIIKIDGMLFPHQDVSSSTVEVEPKNLIKLRKEYGDECLRIIGHWHSHHNMGAFWSGTDNEFINTYSKTKDISLFIVSSTRDRFKIKLVINKPFEIKLDNLNYKTIWNNETFENDLKKVIKEKVTKKEIATYIDYGYGDSYNHDQTRFYNGKTEKEEIKLRITEAIRYNAQTGNITIKDLTLDHAKSLKKETKEYLPTITKEKNNMSEIIYNVIYETKDKEKAINLIKEIKFYLEEIFDQVLSSSDLSYQDWGY